MSLARLAKVVLLAAVLGGGSAPLLVRAARSAPVESPTERALAWAASGPSNPATEEGSWHLYCLAFVAKAYREAGVRDEELEPRSARESFDAFARTSVVHDPAREPPPRGAVVFWDWVARGVDYGHVAIANGDGTCATTCAPGKGDGAGTIQTRCPLAAFAHLHALGWIDPVTRK